MKPPAYVKAENVKKRSSASKFISRQVVLRLRTVNDSWRSSLGLDADCKRQGPRVGPGTLCLGSGTTHQGSRNMVATLKPIRMHMSMNTGRLSGRQATVATAGMKSCHKDKSARIGVGGGGGGGKREEETSRWCGSHRQSHENRRPFANPQQRVLPQRYCDRSCHLSEPQRRH